MLMLSDEKMVGIIKKYDSEFKDDSDYVYAVIEGGLKKKKAFMWIVFFIVVFMVSFTIDNSILYGAIVGGFVGFFVASMNDYCVIVADSKQLNFYVFNKIMSEVKNKVSMPYKDIEIQSIKKRSIWNTIKLRFNQTNVKVVISEKTLGLKNQNENSKKLIEKVNDMII